MASKSSDQGSESTRKVFVPLENNPVVFTQLIHDLGVSTALSFHDVYSIDDPDLLAIIPRPVPALIFIAPPEVYHRARDEEQEQAIEYSGSGEHPVMWFRQTIHEACGLMALIHAICNGEVKQFIEPGSIIDTIRNEAIPLKPAERAKVLEDSERLAKAHAAAAQLGDTEAPPLGTDAPHHFLCFVKGDDGHLWELNGATKGPLDRGLLQPDEDALSPKALDLGVRSFFRNAVGDLNFSIVALALE